MKSENPGARLIRYLLTHFRNQPIFEWETFPEKLGSASSRGVTRWSIGPESATESQDCLGVFRDREGRSQTGHWNAWFWFDALELSGGEWSPSENLAIGDFVARYQTIAERIARNAC